ncbi:hypothetical protein MP638_006546, partial [Amoeboaphelidium occidentale]
MQSISFQENQAFLNGLDYKVRQIDLVSGKVVRTISLNSVVSCVATSEQFLFLGESFSPYLSQFNMENGAMIQSLVGHSDRITRLFLLDSFLFSGSDDTTIICWNTANGALIRKYVGHSESIDSLAVFDGELYSAAPCRELFKWSFDDGLITQKFSLAQFYNIQSLAYKSQTLFTGSFDTTVIKWNASLSVGVQFPSVASGTG